MTIQEVSDLYRISRNHLVKIVNHLANLKLIETTRGRNGGIRMLADPQDIVIGDVVKAVEPSLQLAECFDAESNQCLIAPLCGFKPVLQEAQRAFFEVLGRYTLADLLSRPQELAGLFAAREAEETTLPEAVPIGGGVAAQAAQGASRSMPQLPDGMRRKIASF